MALQEIGQAASAVGEFDIASSEDLIIGGDVVDCFGLFQSVINMMSAKSRAVIGREGSCRPDY